VATLGFIRRILAARTSGQGGGEGVGIRFVPQLDVRLTLLAQSLRLDGRKWPLRAIGDVCCGQPTAARPPQAEHDRLPVIVVRPGAQGSGRNAQHRPSRRLDATTKEPPTPTTSDKASRGVRYG
jgi:hypothetical protein